MYRFSNPVTFGFALLALTGCGTPPPPAPTQAAVTAAPRDILRRIVERYWEEHAPSSEALSAQALADSLAVERRYLAEAQSVPAAGLDPASRLTYEIFIRQRRLAIEGFTYPAELLAFDPFDGVPLQFARTAADAAPRAPLTPKESQAWLRRIDAYVAWSQQSIANMREGLRRGYTSPRALIERALPALARLGEDSSGNVFNSSLVNSNPVNPNPGSGADSRGGLHAAIREKLLPAYRAQHDFLQREYLPRARLGLALSELPLGRSWYAYRVKCATGGDLGPGDIHAIGKSEVERLHARIQALGGGVAATAPKAASIADEAALLDGYRDLKGRALAALPTAFAAAPPSDFEIRAGGPLRETDAPLEYHPADPPRGTPAVLFVDSSPGMERPAGVLVPNFLEAALPGHHYQSSVQQQRADLPRFRRFGTEPAFVDGWGLYAASLGEELGFYRDDAAKADALSRQLACAAALVVDTGLHAQAWTRVQAEDYLHTQLAWERAQADLMIDRIAARPADALACLMGELKLRALRSQAEQALGNRFNLREFHAALLEEGAMPLDLLEDKMKIWLESRR
jgi:uncharacterized protein (DUF885 family)